MILATHLCCFKLQFKSFASKVLRVRVVSYHL